MTMRFWRAIAGDRYSGGVIGALLLLSLALQVMLAGPAAAAIAPHADICTAAANGSHSPEHRQECPCSLLCQAGVQALATLTPADLSGIPIRFAEHVAPIRDSAGIADRILVSRHRHARAPPASLQA